MSERVSVYLTVLSANACELEGMVDDIRDYAERRDNDNETTTYLIEEVSYGVLSFLSDLRDQGIAYDSEWGYGYDIEEGIESFRFLKNGDSSLKTIYKSEKNPDLDHMKTLLDRPDDLIKFIEKHIESLNIEPWNGQFDYSKLYKTKRLIFPKGPNDCNNS